MFAVIIRIALRYIAAFLVSRGLLSPDVGGTLAADDDVVQMIQMVLGALVGVAAEAWLYAERRFGGNR